MRHLIIILFFLSFTNLKAQSLEKQVLGSLGNTSTASGMKLTATVGELAVETKTGSFTLTEGYHQAFSDENVAIKDIKINVDYSLYPNPSTDIINLKLDFSENISGTLLMYNALGEIVLDAKTFSGIDINTEFNISKLTNGIYFVNIVFQNNEKHQISFVKK